MAFFHFKKRPVALKTKMRERSERSKTKNRGILKRNNTKKAEQKAVSL